MELFKPSVFLLRYHNSALPEAIVRFVTCNTELKPPTFLGYFQKISEHRDWGSSSATKYGQLAGHESRKPTSVRASCSDLQSAENPKE